MAKITFKVPAAAFEAAADRGDFEQAPVGTYIGKLTACEPHLAQTDGKPDKTKPSLECIYQIVGVGKDNEMPPVRYSQLWDYVSMRPTEDTDWKRAQFALAMSLADGKKAFAKAVDTDTLLGTLVVMRIKADKDQSGNYRAKVGFVGPYGGDEGDAFEEEPDAFDEDPDADGEPEAEPEAGDDALYSEDDLKAMEREPLKALCDAYEIPTKGKKKAELITAVLEAQAEAVDEEADAGTDDEEPF